MHKKHKRRLASLLAAVMLITALPVTALADEDGEDVPEISVQAPAEDTAGGEEGSEALTEPAEVPDEPAEEDAEAASDAADSCALTEIGFWIGGQYVPAVEEDGGISVMSLLPLEEKRYDLDLTGFFPEELKETQISWVLENLTGNQKEDVTASDVAVWAKWYYYDENYHYVSVNDNYILINDANTMDLSNFYRYGSSRYPTNTVYLELIIGKADQLDSSNRRYIISAETSVSPLEVTPKDGIELLSWDRSTVSNEERERFNQLYLDIDPDTWDGTAPFAVTMSLNNAFSKNGVVSAEFYEGYCTTSVEAERGERITSQIYGASASGYTRDFSQKELANKNAVTAVFERNGKVVEVLPFYIYAYPANDSVSLSSSLRKYQSNSYLSYVSTGTTSYVTDEATGVQMNVIELYSSTDTADSEYYIHAYYSHYGETVQLSEISQYVSHSVLGYYETVSEARNQPDITQQLFDDDSGYPANYSGNGKTFTVVLKDGSLKHLGAIIKEVEEEPSGQTYFRANGAYKTQDRDSYENYRVGTDDDSYAEHYQTVFLMGRESYRDPMTPVTADEIYPTFSVHSKARVVAAADGKDLGKQTSGHSSVPFASGEAIEYTVYSEDNSAHDNYFVTFITQQKGAKLYVNAQNCIDADGKETYRTIYLDAAEDYHDILFANIGDEELTGLYVKLEGADNLQLDPYWTISEDSVSKLAPFTTTNERTPSGSYASYGELSNLGKIRLIPKMDENGEVVSGLVDGYLTIGSANGGEVKIRLTGTTGRLTITNTDLISGVQYVPYSSGIRTNSINANNNLEYTLLEGPLPSPLTLNPNTGEIYGVPKSYGEFPIKVQVRYKNLPDGLPEDSLERMTATAEYTLTILENTDDNVWNATDEDYTVTETIGNATTGNHYVWSSGDDIFISQGEFSHFLALYLDGDRLIIDVDYDAVSGSTVITVRSQTLGSKGNGNHTLAAEFRDSNGDLRKAAQNYEVKVNTSNSGSSSKPSSNKKPSSSSKPSSTPSVSQPTTPTPSTPTTPSTPSTGMPFTDILPNSWFLGDVKWVYEQELMTGTSGSSFAPNTPISQAVIVTVLARMAKVDLTQFDGMIDDVIQSGQWYTNAALWAKQSGLLPDVTVFTGEEPISRDQMAIMLVKYLRSMGKDTTPPTQPIAFADASLMSQDGSNAFQVLYRYNIFKGVGSGYMDPEGTTTRAQFAALVHRISDMV
ncbi:MAG: S-layer homology domain-containing protein [Oscillospiraceae bacterium]|nr:S-layer homology domain-containing protein [Oscillospiraceae bacterium]